MAVSDSWRSFSVRELLNISITDSFLLPLILKRTEPLAWTLSKWALGLLSWPSPPPSFSTSHRRRGMEKRRKEKDRDHGMVHRKNLRKIQLLGLHHPHDDRFLWDGCQG